MRLIPSEGSGRYSPGPGMVELLEERSYQEIRPPVAICSQTPTGILAIDSVFKRPSLAGFERPLTYEALEVMRCLRDGLRESPIVPLSMSVDVMETMDEVRR